MPSATTLSVGTTIARLPTQPYPGLVIPTRAYAPLAAAAACALSAVVVWLTAYHLTPFETIDQRTFDGFLGLSRPATTQWATHLSHLADPGPFALFAAALVVGALARRRAADRDRGRRDPPRLEPSRPSSSSPRSRCRPPYLGVNTASWPSGHATAAMALVLCLLLVVPARLRPAAAAGGGLLAVGIVYSVLILGHHEPSDILGGFLVAGTWTGLVVAALRTAAPHRHHGTAPRRHADPRRAAGGRGRRGGGPVRPHPLGRGARLRRRAHHLRGRCRVHRIRGRWAWRP